MDESIKSNRPFSQLGLPPMELAESSESERSNNVINKCILPILQKVMVILLVFVIGVGTYILLIRLLGNGGDTHSTKIIVITGIRETPNITVNENVDIILLSKNRTSDNSIQRKKRHANISPSTEETLAKFKDNDFLKARDIIMKHDVLCKNDNQKEICKDLVMKLKAITENSESDNTNENTSKITSELKFVKETTEKKDKLLNTVNPTDIAKRDTNSFAKKEGFPISHSHVISESRDNNIHGHSNLILPPHSTPYSYNGASQQLTDTCLLARLLKQKHPSTHGIYEVPVSEYIVPQHDDLHRSISRYYMPPTLQQYFQSRDVDNRKRKMHPQDFDIFMSFLTPRPETSTTENQANSTVRVAECPAGTLPCGSGDSCVMEKQWCDGNVDCPDVSDELRCGCKSRVDKSRLCDGYFDCPFGEDEMGCYGCTDSTFSCGDIDINLMSTCFLPDQRCNNVMDCPNHRDEIECNMLAPSLHKKPLYAISNTEGFLHRNFKGKWYAVCQNPYMWAHDACRRETGHITRPPFIQVMPIDPLIKVSYLNSGLGGLLETSDSCLNSSAIYVTCPELMCGTRISPTSQILRENTEIENHLFGRNKRFLITHPYPMMFYRKRMKRHVNASSVNRILVDMQSNDFGGRMKRTESRVVGGKPSQPAAWPWMVAIYRDGMFHCGGVVVSQSWIMSAAHCVHKFWDHYYEIQVGMLRRFSFSPQEQNHKVTHVIVNQYYSQTDMKNDLSLLRVDPAIQYSRWVRPICLPSPESAGRDWLWGPSPGTICTAVGWGATKEHGPDPDHMREVEVPIWEKCKYRDDRAGKEICAGFVEGGKDACQGDSGGPLLCRNPLNSQQWYMAGIVSHGDGCARKDEPGVYTRVSLFVKWIRYHISSKSLPIVQPVQECPGFKCESGISKCLPNKRKCDKIIDCLDGEDEINCSLMRTSSDTKNNLFLTSSNTDNNVTHSIIKESDLESNKSLHKTSPITEDAISSGTHDINIMIFKDHKHQLNSREIESTDPSNTFENDPNHPSTVGTSNAPSSENDYEQFTTEEPNSSTTSEEINEPNRGDMQTISISFSKESLESRSSVVNMKNNNENTVKFTKAADIEEDFPITKDALSHSFESTTTMTTQELIFESTTDSSSIKDGKIKKESKEFVIDFLPNSNSTLFDNTVTESIHEDKNTDFGDQTTLKSNEEEFSSKKLPDFEDKQDIIHKIEDIVFSELQPAKIRKKHRIPQEFQCQRIYQNIPYKHRCDHKADCEDGTDELGCTCTDYLATFDEKLLCDGIFDCADGQDETDCYKCAEDQFLCQRSKICLPMKYMCDSKPQCPEGEDELDCFALSNGKEMFYGFDERPKVNLEGYLTKKHNNEWHVMCEDKLSIEQQEQEANHICRYLGFSSANRYHVKYLQVNEDEIAKLNLENKRKKRGTSQGIPIHFAYREVEENDLSRSIVFKEPQILKEHCVPNITKTCQSLYVFCEHSLFTNFDNSQNFIFNRAATSAANYMWPWIAKIYVEGEYKCTGNLLNLSWVLISQSCLWDTSSNSYITAVFGSYRTLISTNGLYEQIQQVDAKKDIYTSKVTLLHLKEPVNYTNTVKPMVVSFPNMPKENNELCVAVGQDNKNNTINVFLEETIENCNPHNRCFVRRSKENICSLGDISNLQWAGIISCHSEMGWYPAASFVDSRGECGLGEHIVGSYIKNLKNEVRQYSNSKEQSTLDECEGTRCGRGRCMLLRQVCNGVRDCEDGNDESNEACKKKQNICEKDPHHNGCECSSGQLKCRNGLCVSKELFGNGHDDCGDGTDEPGHSSCSDYLARVMPSKLCDGILHCHDRSDEDPMFCKCFAKRTFKCSKSSNIDHCVAPDMVCDGIRDCPNGEDERTCIALNAPEGTTYGTGQVIVRSHGVWHSKCYTTQNHTKSELEAICRELGFISGHAKKVKEMEIVHPHNHLLLDPFSDVELNNNTIIKMRNSHEPIAKPVFDKDLKNCFPVFIECL